MPRSPARPAPRPAPVAVPRDLAAHLPAPPDAPGSPGRPLDGPMTLREAAGLCGVTADVVAAWAAHEGLSWSKAGGRGEPVVEPGELDAFLLRRGLHRPIATVELLLTLPGYDGLAVHFEGKLSDRFGEIGFRLAAPGSSPEEGRDVLPGDAWCYAIVGGSDEAVTILREAGFDEIEDRRDGSPGRPPAAGV